MTVAVLEQSESLQDRFYSFGVVVLPGVFSASEVSRLRAAAEHVRDGFHAYVDEHSPGLRNSNCMRQVEEPIWHAGSQDHRIALMEAAADARLVGAVEQIFQSRALWFCSSLFMNPRFESSGGPWHRDVQFVSADEDEVKRRIELPMHAVQLQIALVDSDDIEYVPYSSTRYDSPEEYSVRVADNWTHAAGEMPYSVRVRLRAGDAVMFNANGLHRGRCRADIPRLTLMETYTVADLDPVFDTFRYQPWMMNPSFSEGLSPRAKTFVEEVIAVYRPYWEGPVLDSPFR